MTWQNSMDGERRSESVELHEENKQELPNVEELQTQHGKSRHHGIAVFQIKQQHHPLPHKPLILTNSPPVPRHGPKPKTPKHYSIIGDHRKTQNAVVPSSDGRVGRTIIPEMRPPVRSSSVDSSRSLQASLEASPALEVLRRTLKWKKEEVNDKDLQLDKAKEEKVEVGSSSPPEAGGGGGGGQKNLQQRGQQVHTCNCSARLSVTEARLRATSAALERAESDLKRLYTHIHALEAQLADAQGLSHHRQNNNINVSSIYSESQPQSSHPSPRSRSQSQSQSQQLLHSHTQTQYPQSPMLMGGDSPAKTTPSTTSTTSTTRSIPNAWSPASPINSSSLSQAQGGRGGGQGLRRLDLEEENQLSNNNSNNNANNNKEVKEEEKGRMSDTTNNNNNNKGEEKKQNELAEREKWKLLVGAEKEAYLRKVLERWLKAAFTKRRFRKLVQMYTVSKFAVPLRNRNKVLKEIVSSEESYLVGLGKLKQCFSRIREGVGEDDPCIPHFVDFDVLYTTHRAFLSQLQARMEDWPLPVKISEVFLEVSPKLREYTQFVSDFAKFQDCMERVDPTWMAAAEGPSWKSQAASLLITPIQRVPRYIMLLKELMKYTSHDHTEFVNLGQALVKMSEQAHLINEAKRESEQLMRLTEISKRLRGEINLMPVIAIGWLKRRLPHAAHTSSLSALSDGNPNSFSRKFAVLKGPCLLCYDKPSHYANDDKPSESWALEGATLGAGSTLHFSQVDIWMESAPGGGGHNRGNFKTLPSSPTSSSANHLGGSSSSSASSSSAAGEKAGTVSSKKVLTLDLGTADAAMIWRDRLLLATNIKKVLVFSELSANHRVLKKEGPLWLWKVVDNSNSNYYCLDSTNDNNDSSNNKNDNSNNNKNNKNKKLSLKSSSKRESRLSAFFSSITGGGTLPPPPQPQAQPQPQPQPQPLSSQQQSQSQSQHQAGPSLSEFSSMSEESDLSASPVSPPATLHLSSAPLSISSNYSLKLIARTVFQFNDLVLAAHPIKGCNDFDYEDVVHMSEVEAIHSAVPPYLHPGDLWKKLKKSEGGSEVKHLEKEWEKHIAVIESRRERYIVITPSPQDREAWVQSMQQTLDSTNSVLSDLGEATPDQVKRTIAKLDLEVTKVQGQKAVVQARLSERTDFLFVKEQDLLEATHTLEQLRTPRTLKAQNSWSSKKNNGLNGLLSSPSSPKEGPVDRPCTDNAEALQKQRDAEVAALQQEVDLVVEELALLNERLTELNSFRTRYTTSMQLLLARDMASPHRRKTSRTLAVR